MAEAGKRVEVRLGTFSCSIEGYDNPVEQMREVLLLLQQMIRETPALADRGPGFGEAEVARIEDAMDGRAARAGESGPGILVIRAPENGPGARSQPEDAVTTADIPPGRGAAPEGEGAEFKEASPPAEQPGDVAARMPASSASPAAEPLADSAAEAVREARDLPGHSAAGDAPDGADEMAGPLRDPAPAGTGHAPAAADPQGTPQQVEADRTSDLAGTEAAFGPDPTTVVTSHAPDVAEAGDTRRQAVANDASGQACTASDRAPSGAAGAADVVDGSGRFSEAAEAREAADRPADGASQPQANIPRLAEGEEALSGSPRAAGAEGASDRTWSDILAPMPDGSGEPPDPGDPRGAAASVPQASADQTGIAATWRAVAGGAPGAPAHAVGPDSAANEAHLPWDAPDQLAADAVPTMPEDGTGLSADLRPTDAAGHFRNPPPADSGSSPHGAAGRADGEGSPGDDGRGASRATQTPDIQGGAAAGLNGRWPLDEGRAAPAQPDRDRRAGGEAADDATRGAGPSWQTAATGASAAGADAAFGEDAGDGSSPAPDSDRGKALVADTSGSSPLDRWRRDPEAPDSGPKPALASTWQPDLTPEAGSADATAAARHRADDEDTHAPGRVAANMQAREGETPASVHPRTGSILDGDRRSTQQGDTAEALADPAPEQRTADADAEAAPIPANRRGAAFGNIFSPAPRPAPPPPAPARPTADAFNIFAPPPAAGPAPAARMTPPFVPRPAAAAPAPNIFRSEEAGVSNLEPPAGRAAASPRPATAVRTAPDQNHRSPGRAAAAARPDQAGDTAAGATGAADAPHPQPSAAGRHHLGGMQNRMNIFAARHREVAQAANPPSNDDLQVGPGRGRVESAFPTADADRRFPRNGTHPSMPGNAAARAVPEGAGAVWGIAAPAASPVPAGSGAGEHARREAGGERGRFSGLLARLGRLAGSETSREPSVDPQGERAPVAAALDGDAGAAKLAERARARTVPDLLAVAAAWLTLVEGKPRFTRREVMETFERLPGDHARTLEARIKGFGQLVRSSTLILVDDGVFAMAQSERDRFQAMIDDV